MERERENEEQEEEESIKKWVRNISKNTTNPGAREAVGPWS